MSLFTNTTRFLQDKLDTKYWTAKVTLVLVLFSLVFATPAYYYMNEAINGIGWKVVMRQVDADGLYQPTGVAPGNQAAKKTFRLTVPLLAKVLHLREYGIYALQFLLGIVFIYLVTRFTFRLTNDRLMAVLFAAGFTSLFVGRACFTDIYSRFEGWCYLFLFLCIFFQRAWVIALLAFLACWTDERAVIGLGYVMLWWLYRDGYFKKLDRPKASRWFTGNPAAVVYGILAYGVLRVVMQFGFGYYTPMKNVNVAFILYDFEYFNAGIWTFLEGMWLLVLYALWLLLKNRNYTFLVLSLLLISANTVASFFVFDVTKTGSFMFIHMFTSLLVIHEYTNWTQVKKVLTYAALVTVLYPPYYIILHTGVLGPHDPAFQQQHSIFTLAVKFLTQRYLPLP